MNKPSILLVFMFWTTICFGQSELKGTWILESYIVEGRKPIEIKDRLKKEKITFDTGGRYLKTYHEEELPDGARIQMTYNTLDREVTKKYFDRNGYEIKVVQVKKKIDNGTYQIVRAGQIIFLIEKDSYTKMFEVDGPHLSIADTLDNRVIWRRYKKRS
jgi:hypothetical protein